jgi:hypothetical protein
MLEYGIPNFNSVFRQSEIVAQGLRTRSRVTHVHFRLCIASLLLCIFLFITAAVEYRDFLSNEHAETKDSRFEGQQHRWPWQQGE